MVVVVGSGKGMLIYDCGGFRYAVRVIYGAAVLIKSVL